MRFFGSRLYCCIPQFRSKVLSGSDTFLPYALERKCVTTDIVSSGVVGLATSEMMGVDGSTCLGVSLATEVVKDRKTPPYTIFRSL
jgi:hypothetical protein